MAGAINVSVCSEFCFHALYFVCSRSSAMKFLIVFLEEFESIWWLLMIFHPIYINCFLTVVLLTILIILTIEKCKMRWHGRYLAFAPPPAMDNWSPVIWRTTNQQSRGTNQSVPLSPISKTTHCTLINRFSYFDEKNSTGVPGVNLTMDSPRQNILIWHWQNIIT